MRCDEPDDAPVVEVVAASSALEAIFFCCDFLDRSAASAPVLAELERVLPAAGRIGVAMVSIDGDPGAPPARKWNAETGSVTVREWWSS